MAEKECPYCHEVMKGQALNFHIRHHHPETLQHKETPMIKESELKKVMDLAGKAGISGEALLKELKEAVSPDMPKFVEDVALKVESRVGAKLADVLETLKASTDGNKPDTEGIIKGVANLLQPQIVEAAKQASEAVFQANSQALLQQVFEKLQQASSEGSKPQGLANMSAGGLIEALLANSDGIAKLVQAFKGPQSADAKIAEQLGLMLRYHKILSSLETGKGNIDEIQALMPISQ